MRLIALAIYALPARACDVARSSLLRALKKPASSAAIIVRVLAAGLKDAELLELSERLRHGGADAVQLRASDEQLQLVLDEQRRATADFPGPCPVLFEPAEAFPPDMAACGAHAVVLPCRLRSSWVCDVPSAPMCAVEVADAEDFRASAQTCELVIATGAAVDLALACSSEFAAAIMVHIKMAGVHTPNQIRAVREAGCAGVVVNFPEGAPPAAALDFVSRLRSKKSATFGSYGLQIGFSSFMSDQYWLNRKFKEAGAMQRGRRD